MLELIRKRIAHHFDTDALQAAITKAELETSAEIRVSIGPFFWGSVDHAARVAFERLGMTSTKERNGVLFFVVPSRRRFVVFGDEGIHAKVGQKFWEEVASAISTRFRAGDFTGGLIQGIEEVGCQLAKHFPYEPGQDKNELSNAVDLGETPPRG